MREEVRDLWVNTAEVLLVRMLVAVHGDLDYLDVATTRLSKVVDAIGATMGDDLGKRSPAVARAALRSVRRNWENGFQVGEVGDRDREVGLHVAAVLLGHALAFGDVARLRADERVLVVLASNALVGRCLRSPLLETLRARFTEAATPPKAVARSKTSGQGVPDQGARDAVTFRFVWTRRVGSSDVPTTSTAVTSLHHVHLDEAPVVCRLSTPDGGRLDLRVVDGVLFRPITAPLSWKPVDLSTFRRAVVEGVAWADDPFAKVDRSSPLSALEDVAAPEPTRLGAKDAARRDGAVVTVSCGAGPLTVIDGIVHRTCPVPIVHAVAKEEVAFAWTIPGQLSSLDDVTTVLRLADRRVRHFAPRSGAILSEPTRADPDSFACLPAHRSADLPDLVGSCMSVPPGCVVPCEVVRPDLMPATPGNAVDALADFLDRQEDDVPGRFWDARAGCAAASAALRSGAEAHLPDVYLDAAEEEVTDVCRRSLPLLVALRRCAQAEVDLSRESEPDLVDLMF